MPRTLKDRATSVHLPADALARVDALAALEGISRSAFIRRLIITELREQQDARGGAA